MAIEAVQRQQFLEPVARRFVDRVALGDSLKFDGVHGETRKTSVTEVSRVWNGRCRGERKEKGDRRPHGPAGESW
jgi:hypothetical protein